MKSPSVVCLLLLLVSTAAVAQSNPVPMLNQPLIPSSAVEGGAGFTLTVNGTGFVTGASVRWNGSPRNTTFVNSSQLSAKITAADVAARGTASVTVMNPGPGGGPSNSVFFPVTVSGTVGFIRGSKISLGGPTSVVTGDFNHDGFSDAAFAEGNLLQITVLLSNGDGSFQPPVSYSVGCYADTLIAADFNGDGNLDLVTSSSSDCSGFVFEDNTLLGNGDGTFQPALISPGVDAQDRIAGDFNGDGSLDLISVYTSCTCEEIQLGNKDGTFQDPKFIALTSFSYSGAAGDFNRDGKLDFVVANGGTFDMTVFLGKGDGTFSQGQTYDTDGYPLSVTVADLDNDGKLDAAVASGNIVSIFFGNGDGTFHRAVHQRTGISAKTVIAGDFDGDGDIDLVTANFGDKTVTVLLSDGHGDFPDHLAYFLVKPPAGGSSEILAAGDFNNDGRLDLIACDFRDSAAILMLQSEMALSETLLLFPSNIQKRSVTLSNIGQTSIALTGMAIIGKDTGSFSVSTDCPGDLSPNASCVAQVTFTGVTDSYAILSISDDATSSPQRVKLHAFGR